MPTWITAHRHRGVKRPASAWIEAVVTLPLLSLLTLAAAEGVHGLQLQQSLKTIAYETARAAVVPGVTTDEVDAFAQRLFEDRRISRGQVHFEPTDLRFLKTGEFARVTITAPHRRNGVMLGWLVAWRELEAHVELMKEQ
jgi:hypothetical protein